MSFLHLSVWFCYLDAYTYRINSYCPETDYIEKHDELSKAIINCNKDENCTMVYDFGCDGNYWHTCSGLLKEHSKNGSCTWVKNTGII